MTSATELRVLSTIATREAFLALAPGFESAEGRKLATTWSGTADIVKRMTAGERYDLVIAPRGTIDELAGLGRVDAGSRVDLARSVIGMAVRRGAPRPEIGSTAALTRALLAARTVGYSSGPSGVYLVGLFERLGIAAAIQAKARQVAPGMTVGSIIAGGEAEIGFQQMSELLPIDGIDVVGPLPAELQHVTVIACGLPTGGPDPATARALVRFLTTPAAHAVFTCAGLQPA